jgi:hypothetical protein
VSTGQASSASAPARTRPALRRRRERDGAARRRPAAAERLLTLATGLAAALPVIASTARAVADGWLPAGDQANIVTRAHDVFTARTPLVGLHSDVSVVTHHAVYNLGPMLFWLLALPARIGSPVALTITVGVVNVLAVVGAVALARRRGGRLLMFMTAIALAVMCRSLAPEVLHDVWNPSAALLPFTLLIFLCWSLACGEYRLLPVTVLVASFVVQCQLTFVVPCAGLLLVGLAGLALSLRASRKPAEGPRRRREDAVRAPPGERDGAARAAARSEGAAAVPGRGRVRWWLLAAVVVAAACWTAPLIDEVREPRGNLTAVFDTATANEPTMGASVGARAVVRAVGIVPWWLRDPASPWNRKQEVRSGTSVLARVSCALALCALVALAALGLRSRRRELLGGALIGLVLCAALALDAASTPTIRVLAETLGYTMWWGSAAGMFVWLVLAWPAAELLLHRVPAARRSSGRPPARAALLAGAAGLAAAALAGALVAAAERPDYHLPEYRPLGAMYAALDRSVPHGRTVLLTGALGSATFRFKMAARFAMVRRGIRPVSPGTDTRLGTWYELGRLHPGCAVYVRDGTRSPARGAEAIARLHFQEGASSLPVTVWLAPAGCPAGVRTGAHPGARSL